MNNSGTGRDDSDLRDDSQTTSQSSNAGGTLATDIGSKHVEKAELGPERTMVTRADNIQHHVYTRTDHEGAAS
jgi:hypothetical protein